MGLNADTRLYASSIAIVSGVYSISTAAGIGSGPMGAGGLGVSSWVMLAVGVAVLLHGIVLLTPAAERLRRQSGPLMVLWATIMLANQALAAVMPGWAMGQAVMGVSSMAWDGGMVAIAVLMLVSGLIMGRAKPSTGM